MTTTKNSFKFLVVEDNEQDQKIIRRHLSGAGHNDVLLVPTGEQALHIVEECQPDIIIIDTRLPGMDGFEVCRKIKHIPKFHPKVIMMTGFIDAVDAGRAREVEADEYCAKTADCEHLLDAVRLLLPELS